MWYLEPHLLALYWTSSTRQGCKYSRVASWSEHNCLPWEVPWRDGITYAFWPTIICCGLPKWKVKVSRQYHFGMQGYEWFYAGWCRDAIEGSVYRATGAAWLILVILVASSRPNRSDQAAVVTYRSWHDADTHVPWHRSHEYICLHSSFISAVRHHCVS
jgi:hypothetical protein